MQVRNVSCVPAIGRRRSSICAQGGRAQGYSYGLWAIKNCPALPPQEGGNSMSGNAFIGQASGRQNIEHKDTKLSPKWCLPGMGIEHLMATISIRPGSPANAAGNGARVPEKCTDIDPHYIAYMHRFPTQWRCFRISGRPKGLNLTAGGRTLHTDHMARGTGPVTGVR